jgi:hypothetical protein
VTRCHPSRTPAPNQHGTPEQQEEVEMNVVVRGATLGIVAVTAVTAMLAAAPAPTFADEPGSCVWYEEPGEAYPPGTYKEEFWGTETRPDGRMYHRFRIFRCVNGAWWYEGDKYYPAERDRDDDDDWDGHREILT